MKTSEEIVQSEVVDASKFSETNKRIRYMYRNARMAEARETIEKYIAENYNPEELDIEELSKIYIRYVIVLQKQFDYATISRVFIKQVEPTLRIARD
jgi:hypothetical protein